MTANSLVRKLSFTGSTEVGKILMRDCAATVKKFPWNLAGMPPLSSLATLILTKPFAGRSPQNIAIRDRPASVPTGSLFKEGVYELFAAKLVAAVQQLKVGQRFRGGGPTGAIDRSGAVLKVEEQIDDAVARGARIACGGKRLAGAGFFFEPTVLLNATTDC